MIKEQIAYRAIQSLSVDVANLTTRVAMVNAQLGMVLEIVNTFEQQTWKDNGGGAMALPMDEYDKLQQLLTLVESMR